MNKKNKILLITLAVVILIFLQIGLLFHSAFKLNAINNINKDINILFNVVDKRLNIDNLNENELLKNLNDNIENSFNSGTYSCDSKTSWQPIYGKNISLIGCNDLHELKKYNDLEYEPHLIFKDNKVKEFFIIFKGYEKIDLSELFLNLYYKNKNNKKLTVNLIKEINIDPKECSSLGYECQLKISIKY